jgi:Tfp pilus assembly protein PilO
MKKLHHIVLLTTLVGIGLLIHQGYLYSTQWGTLQNQHEQVAKLSARIEGAMYEEASLRQQLSEVEHEYARLRQLLPETLQEEQLEHQLETLAGKLGIKVLALRTAVNSRPGYHEAGISITLEADVTAANRFMRELKSIPRRIHIVPPEKRGKKSIHLSISIYAVSQNAHEPASPPRCTDMPHGVWLPPLRERIAKLYMDYSKQCQFISRYADHYLRQQRIQALQQENMRLSRLEQKLRHRP